MTCRSHSRATRDCALFACTLQSRALKQRSFTAFSPQPRAHRHARLSIRTASRAGQNVGHQPRAPSFTSASAGAASPEDSREFRGARSFRPRRRARNARLLPVDLLAPHGQRRSGARRDPDGEGRRGHAHLAADHAAACRRGQRRLTQRRRIDISTSLPKGTERYPLFGSRTRATYSGHMSALSATTSAPARRRGSTSARTRG